MDTARILVDAKQMCEAGKAYSACPARRPQIIPRERSRLNRGAASIRGGKTSIDGEQMAGHVIGGGGREEHRSAGDFRRLAPAAGRRATCDPGRERAVGGQRR